MYLKFSIPNQDDDQNMACIKKIIAHQAANQVDIGHSQDQKAAPRDQTFTVKTEIIEINEDDNIKVVEEFIKPNPNKPRPQNVKDRLGINGKKGSLNSKSKRSQTLRKTTGLSPAVGKKTVKRITKANVTL